MTVLITGKPDSGKSALAEEVASGTGDDKRYYIATMRVIDEDARLRVIKHRKQREGKGFVTIEEEHGIDGVLERISDPKSSTVLLECVSNLVGNLMYDFPERLDNAAPDDVGFEPFAKDIAGAIERLASAVSNMIIVTAEYDDDEKFDEETRTYIKLLDAVNEKLPAFADKVYDLGRKERS